jgi:ATP-dependent DNA helicase RecG
VPIQLTDNVSKIPLIGPAYVRRLEKLEIITVRDLLYYLPFRYDDFSLVSKIADIQNGEAVTVSGTILEIKNIFTRGGFVLQQAKIDDGTGTLDVLWFNQRFLTRVIHKNDEISLSGRIELNGKKLVLKSPVYEIGSKIHTGRLVPVYSETVGISSKWLRSRLAWLLKNVQVEEYLDPKIFDLMPLSTAIVQIHFPDNLENASAARKRLAFDELLWSHLQATVRKEELQKQCVGNRLEIVNIRNKLTKFVDKLPFELTKSQKKVIGEIYEDLGKNTPMNRLLQGDVGSGKTVVAAMAMLATNLNGFQAALMAPTEILANQHFLTLKNLGFDVGLATATIKKYDQAKIIVGTHALLSKSLNFSKLGLVVIDEQHRFGVAQRAALIEKGTNPHVLTMTATPIPRTIALTLYGDLDISILDEMPSNRLPVKTWVVPEKKREAAYQWIDKQNSQTFIICPLIEESETLATVKAATTEFETIKKLFPHKRVGLIHGRMKDKNKVLTDFKNQKLDILVATPVVEVGIDISTANIIVIETADRFGLAQLHQLRGRVGRGDTQSYCLLFGENHPRLKLMEKINNGMKLAEVDLKFRGPGQRFGTSQHGRWDLKIADFSDLELIEKARNAANSFPLLRRTLLDSKIKYDSLT